MRRQSGLEQPGQELGDRETFRFLPYRPGQRYWKDNHLDFFQRNNSYSPRYINLGESEGTAEILLEKKIRS